MSALSDAPGNMNLKRGLSNTVIPIADDPKGMNKARGRWGSMPRTTLNVPRSTWPWLLLALVALGLWGMWGRRSASSGPAPSVHAMVDPVVPALPTYPDAVFVGHANADVDSLCSAIVAAHLFGAEAAIADGPITRDVDYVIEALHMPRPPKSTDARFKGRPWGLVDFNSHDKLPEGVDADNIVCVVDHHQLLSNAITMTTPRLFLIEPVGSTSTALFFLYQKYRTPVPDWVARCMLAAIVSDTLNLRGPTTTADDRVAAEALTRIAGIADVDAFAKGLFDAKSSVNGLPANEIVQMDYKTYTLASKTVGFGVAETLTPEPLLARKEELIAAVQAAKAARGLDVYLFAIVDMDNLESYHVCAAELECNVVQQMFPEATLRDHVLHIAGLVSRKKDFVPRMTGAVAALANQ